MTAEQKAKELIDKYLKEVFSGDFMPTSFSIECAKECATICCDEILKDAEKQFPLLAITYEETAHYEYWQKVKTIIENS